MSDILTYRGAIYPWHCDHVGHMNVMWYVGKFDEANWNLFARCGITAGYLREQHRGMAAVQQNISYKREMLAGDTVEVRSRVLEVREKLLRVSHVMHDAQSGEVTASCEITAVHMDADARRSCPFPEQIRMTATKLASSEGHTAEDGFAAPTLHRAHA